MADWSDSYDPNTASVPRLFARALVASWTAWKGRATRREFWIGGGILGIVSAAIVYGSFEWCRSLTDDVDVQFYVLEGLCVFLLVLPGMGTVSRRLHDTGRSGLLIAAAFAVALICFCNEPSPDKFDIRWASLAIPAVITIFCMLDSGREPNAWGPSPKFKELPQESPQQQGV
ncbi:MAG: DUF805 domain-containing protein [Akkermansia sp.]|nr:DUF805 domain-containing protein [Akkermansia sp.]